MTILVCIPFWTVLAPVGAWAEAPSFLGLQTFKTYSRLTLNIDGSISSRWKKTSRGFEILLPGSSLIDLGVSPEDSKYLKKQMSDLKDLRIAKLRLAEDSAGVRIIGTWKFPGGKQTLAQPVMDTFDFMEKTPPRLVIDLWVRPGLTLTDDLSQKEKHRLDTALKKMQEDEKARANSQLAIAGRNAEIHDLERYCHQPLSEKDDFFLRFHPVHPKFDLSKWLPQVTADSSFDYFQPEGKSREDQYVRLARKLYLAGNFALAIRTLGFLESEYPRSQFLVEMRFMKANALIKLGHEDAAESILNQLIRDYGKSPVALHSAMFMALKLTQKESPALALEKLLWLIGNHSDHRLNWVFHMGAAECFYALGQTELATREYNWVTENGVSREEGAEGAFRLGDLYLRKFQYERALVSYYQGIQPYEAYGGKFPEYYLNRGETLYQLGQLERAKEELTHFLERFPTHPEGWRASFRLAEIAGRDPQGGGLNSAGFRENLLATVNRYPFSAGAVLARIRLASCGDRGGFDFKTQEKFFSEDAQRFDGSGAVVMVDYPDFRALAHMRALEASGSTKAVLDLALKELKVARSSLVKNFLGDAAHDAFRKTILELLDKGKSYEALSLYVAKSPGLPLHSDATDRDYLLKLSEVASNLELGKLAGDLFQAYKKQTGAKRSLATVAPESKDRLAEQNFALAKSLWIKSKNSLGNKDSTNGTNIIQIKKLLNDLPGESRFSLEKEVILGLIAEHEGDLVNAIQHAAQAKLVQDGVRVESWLANLYLEAKNSSVALKLLASVEKKLTQNSSSISAEQAALQSLGLAAAPDLIQVILTQARIHENEERWGDVASDYSRLMESGVRSNRILFGYARSLVKLGKDSSKETILKTLNEIVKTEPGDPDGNFWKNLAIETLASKKIQDSIQKNAKEGTI